MKNNTLYRYYGQYGEDYILWNFFDYKTSGFFIDVGAFDGIHLSNTFSFEQQGWRGICVEPNQAIYQACKKNRSESFCINAACVSPKNEGEIELYFDTTGLFSGLEINTEADNIKGHYSTLKKEITLKKEKVKALTLDAIIKQCPFDIGPIDFVSIDVEGVELDVLEGFDINNYSPRLILLESNEADSQKKVIEYLSKYGYTFARKHFINSYFVKDTADIEKINSIEVTCVIEKQLHPLGLEYTVQDYYNGVYIYKNRIARSLIQNLERQVQMKDSVIIQKDRNIMEKDGKISDFNDQISGLKKQISDLNEQISDLNEQISELDKKIVRIYNKLTSRISKIFTWPFKNFRINK